MFGESSMGNPTPESPKPEIPSFETLADALSGEDKERFIGLSEQMEAIAKSHGGRIDDARLSSAERELVEEHAVLRARAFENIAMAG
jgi:hypothetical protein